MVTDQELDALLAPARWEPGRCSIDQALTEVPDGWRDRVAAAVADDRVPPVNVVKALARLLEQEPPAEQAVRRHRAGKCKCRV